MELRRRNPKCRFVRTWCIIAAVVVVLWAAVLIGVRIFLSEYETVQPRYAAATVFSDYFTGEALADLPLKADFHAGALETDSAALAWFRAETGKAQLSYKEVLSTDASVKKYAVCAGDRTVATFSLKEGTKKTGCFRLKYPELMDLKVVLQPSSAIVIYAPEQAEVYVNGILLDASYRAGDPVVLEEAPYLPEAEADRRMVNYSVSGLFAAPTVSVKEAGGNGRAITLEAEDGLFNAELGYRTLLAEDYNRAVLEEQARIAEEEARIAAEKAAAEAERQRVSAELIEKYGTYLLEAAEQYSRFLNGETGAALRKATKVYFLPGTQLYDYVTLTSGVGGYANWGVVMTSYDFSGESVTDAEWVDEAHTRFRCHIRYRVDMKSSSGKTGTYNFDNIVYLELRKGTPLIYDLISAAADEAAQKETDKKTENKEGNS